MDMTELLISALWFTIGVIGWFLKGVIDESKDTKKDFVDFKIEVAQHYTHKNDLRDIMVSINERFDRIEKKLDRLMEGR
jgi:hypothetical protein